MPTRTPGRHRRPGRLRAASHLTRSAAIAATSTGLVVGSAVTTATALPASHELASFQDGALAADPAGGPQADALRSLVEAGLLSERATSLDSPARAVAAPADVDPASFGIAGFTAATPVANAVEQEEEAEEAVSETQAQAQAAVESRTETSASRSEERTVAPAQSQPAAQPAAQPTPQPAAQPAPRPAAPPAPQPAAPRSTGGAVGIASGLMGIPYAWAGSSPATGFDCSGFTRYVFAQLGISLPHGAAAQQASTTPVSSPMPGDLVFFGYPAWHVGIYAGNGMIYQATNPGSVSNFMPISSIWGSVSGYGRVG